MNIFTSRDGAVRECKLYVSISSMPVMFFVQIKPYLYKKVEMLVFVIQY